jgi:hypothetical protein
VGCRPLELGRLVTRLATLAASLEFREFLESLVQVLEMPRRGSRLLDLLAPAALDEQVVPFSFTSFPARAARRPDLFGSDFWLTARFPLHFSKRFIEPVNWRI